MRMLSDDARNSLAAEVEEWHRRLEGGPAESYLTNRGISRASAARFQLGFDGNRLVIPYLTPAGPFGVKRRCIAPHTNCKALGHHKYLTDEGLDVHLFNAEVLLTADRVALVEGEIDAISGTAAGVPHVGFPGTQMWKKYTHWVHCFDSVAEILVVGDGDKPGEDGDEEKTPGAKAAKFIAGDLRKHYPDKTIITTVLPGTHDANSYVAEFGDLGYLERIGAL